MTHNPRRGASSKWYRQHMPPKWSLTHRPWEMWLYIVLKAAWTLVVKLLWCEFHLTSLVRNQHRLRLWFDDVRPPAITWANADQVLCPHTALQGHNELTDCPLTEKQKKKKKHHFDEYFRKLSKCRFLWKLVKIISSKWWHFGFYASSALMYWSMILNTAHVVPCNLVNTGSGNCLLPTGTIVDVSSLIYFFVITRFYSFDISIEMYFRTLCVCVCLTLNSIVTETYTTAFSGLSGPGNVIYCPFEIVCIFFL